MVGLLWGEGGCLFASWRNAADDKKVTALPTMEMLKIVRKKGK